MAYHERRRDKGKSSLFDKEPEIDQTVAWFLKAFHRLSASRPLGFGAVGAIPVSEMVAYWDNAGWIGPLEEFIAIIQALDAEYIKGVNPSPGT